jgi:hypothetical protein
LLRAELRVISAGLATPADVVEWSVARLNLWNCLLDEQDLQQHHGQSAAVWKPESTAAALKSIHRRLALLCGHPTDPDSQGEWQAPSRDSILERMRAAGQLVISE